VKVLFVGEGNHDIGPAGERWAEPRPATGVVPVLAREVSSAIDAGSIALAWREISRFSPQARKGFEAKVAAAMLLATQRFDCAGTVCVTDRDGDEDRLPAMQRGKQRGLSALAVAHPVAVGVAVESIEAWILGAPTAIAEELGIPVERVRSAMPKRQVEALRESSDRQDWRPKAAIERIAALAGNDGGTGFRAAVAARTSPAEVEGACPVGFAPFAQELRDSFGGET
jgi:hypothetical protein